ncbi:MAG TPA: hypothetical protein VKA21_06180 [Candidatus Binatia bacterium]|nr:hypothetical protein [Candidatus Binatia bacterium]
MVSRAVARACWIALVIFGTPVFAESPRSSALYLAALPPLDESAISPIGDVVAVDAARRFQFYVVLEAPSVETQVEPLRVEAVNTAGSVEAPAANVTVRVFRVIEGAIPVEVPVRIVSGAQGNNMQWHFCEIGLDVPQVSAGTADPDRVVAGMARSRFVGVRNPPGLYEVRVAYSAPGGRVLRAPAVRFQVAGEPSAPTPLPPARPPQAEPPASSAASEPPAEVVTAFYRALNAGDDVTRFLSSTSLARVATSGARRTAGRDGARHPVTRGGTIARVEVLGERERGSRAWVDVRLHYRDGSAQNYNAGVVREDGAWKIADD